MIWGKDPEGHINLWKIYKESNIYIDICWVVVLARLDELLKAMKTSEMSSVLSSFPMGTGISNANSVPKPCSMIAESKH